MDIICDDNIYTWVANYEQQFGKPISLEDLQTLAQCISDDTPFGEKASIKLADWIMNFVRSGRLVISSDIYETVNHPSHYTQGEIECINAIRASMSYDAFCGYLKGNVIKYLWRYENKNSPVEDLEKAKWYTNKLLENLVK